MGRKPTYEELERRVKWLEKEAVKSKKTDGALYKSKEKYKSIFSSIEEGYYEVDLAGNLTFFNDSLCKIYGYTRDELMGMNNREYMTAKTAKKTYEIFNRVYRTGEPTKIFDWEFIKKDGSKVDVEISVSLIRNSKGRAIGFRGIVRDITERKRIKKKLQESKAMFEAVIENLPFDVFALDCNNRYILQNSTCKKNWGNLIGKSPEDIAVEKHTQELWLKNNRRALSWEKMEDEVIYTKIEGVKNFYYNIISPIYDGKKILGIVGVLVDISRLKQAEKALKQSEKRFRRLVETMNDGLGIQDEKGIITYVNSKFGNMLGYKPENLIGKSVTDFLDDRNKQIFKNEIAIRKKGKVSSYEIEWVCKDGKKIPTIMSPQAIFDEKGQFKGSFSVITNISKFKQVEEESRQSKERFRNLVETTSDWVWEVDKDSRYTYVSPKIRDVLGYHPEEIIGKTPFDLMPTEETDRVSKIFDKIRVKKEPLHCLENINLHKNGHTVVLETSGVPFFDGDGELCGYRGIDRDITQRKQAEMKLKKAHDELDKRVKERTRELEIQKNNIEEANIAMQVLLDKRQGDKKEMEDNVLMAVKEMIAPYVEKFKKTKLSDQQKTLLKIVESNLNEIISPFSRKMSLKFLNLTPAEIHVANLIRYGIDSKEIADIMSLSPQTIYNHRKNIRKKFGLENKKTNLRSHLLSIY